MVATSVSEKLYDTLMMGAHPHERSTIISVAMSRGSAASVEELLALPCTQPTATLIARRELLLLQLTLI